jgi:1-pyrroline-5-carboxylate dehydrogenase
MRLVVPKNETVLEYKPGAEETKKLKEAISTLAASEIEIPLIINGKEVRTGKIETCVVPHQHKKVLAKFHTATAKEVEDAIAGSAKAYQEWAHTSYEHRNKIFKNAAELLATKYRFKINAATMLGQSKTCHQAEIDAACELTDFFRFNTYFQEQIHEIQPISVPGFANRMDYRPLEGFVFAVTPFNFTAIGGNLPTSAAMMGNVSLWKPASTSIFSNYFVMKLLEEAGLPSGVIQFLPGSGAEIGKVVFNHRDFSGLHFTGSTSTFQNLWKEMSQNLSRYRTYPRIVGETGGKDFIMAHESCDPDVLVMAIVRGAFEYQGQKCSAASRAYVPKSVWAKIKDKVISEVKSIRMGDVADFKNFMGAVIDKKSFANIKKYIDDAKSSSKVKILVGGDYSDEVGYFISPTIIETSDPKYTTMCEEIFGPVITIYPYEDNDFEKILTVCDETSPYALTGAIIAQDRKVIEHALKRLMHSAGNFYINNKPTGAIVGQQPFGGARASGTNDKAGSVYNLLRWVSVRTISETLEPPKDYRYPFLS